MVEIRIGTNENGQRLDRFLRKYLDAAPLSLIYKIIRKDVKVNQKRTKNDYMLIEGDVVSLYMDEEEAKSLRKPAKETHVVKTFSVAYESPDVLICDKPAGLLTHGDKHEKKEHLTNEVRTYLAGKGEYDPSGTSTFSPAPVNRLDRNTSGLVIFAKTYDAQKTFASMLRDRKHIKKCYMTIVKGLIDKQLVLESILDKDESSNISAVSDEGKMALTIASPVKSGVLRGADEMITLLEVVIETGRTHQIRVQLANSGHPIAGDRKYGDRAFNRRLAIKYGVSAQLLTAKKLMFTEMTDKYGYMDGLEVVAKTPKIFARVRDDITDSITIDE